MNDMRLDKMLVTLGIGSRTQVQKLIRDRRVTVNGQAVIDPSTHVSGDDRILLDNDFLDCRTERHVMMNKPAGVLTAAQDRKQKTIIDLLPPVYKACGCMPVGRLDKDTEGLLLLTTDGQLAHKLLMPRKAIWKVYRADVDGPLSAADVNAFKQGVELSDFKALPADMTVISADKLQSTALISVCEGKFHQVKRMFLARGRKVLQLKRVAFGPLILDGSLAPGGFRELESFEYRALVSAAAGEGDD
jgi:16S rRNA pseudouridine516 synthase